MSKAYSVAAMEITRPGGSPIRVDRLRAASLQVGADVIRGGPVSGWSTAKPGGLSWSISVDAQNAPNNAGLVAAVASIKAGERVYIEAILGDARRVCGDAYVSGLGRGGEQGSAFSGSVELMGADKLHGWHVETRPDVPLNLNATVSGQTITLAWEKVDGVNGYIVYQGGEGRYPFWTKVPNGDLGDPDNPSWDVTGLVAGRRYFFVVTSYIEV